ncbi:MAG: helix-turn-helix domain-containing protein [Candidatus Andersenbacteria bacterium]|nr:helix-turn-helix domain-containing protein [Candidatus Andersenbacteria bacterium]
MAKLLDVSYQTVLKLKKEGKIKPGQIGRRFYLTGQDILDFVESREDSGAG